MKTYENNARKSILFQSREVTENLSLDTSTIVDRFELSSKSPINFQTIKHILAQQKQQLLRFKSNYTSFIETQMSKFKQYTSVLAKDKAQLNQDLRKSKQIQNCTKQEVIQLKEMINQFVRNYQIEINSRDKEIARLKELLPSSQQSKKSLQQEISVGQFKLQESSLLLDVIQEQSEHTNSESGAITDSTVSKEMPIEDTYENTIPDEKLQTHNSQQTSQEKPSYQVQYIITSPLQITNQVSAKSPPQITTNSPLEVSSEGAQCPPAQQTSRSTILLQTIKLPPQPTAKSPGKQIVGSPQQNISSARILQQLPPWKISGINLSPKNPKVEAQLNKSNSQSSILHYGDTEKINFPQLTQAPNPMAFKARKEFDTIMEPLQRQRHPFLRVTSNKFSNHKRSNSGKRGDSGSSNYTSKHSSKSKEKLKVMSKIIDNKVHMNQIAGRMMKTKSSVLFGSKKRLKKILSQIMNNLKQFKSCSGNNWQLVKNHSKGRMRSGKGMVAFSNGMVYEGDFKDNMRHGSGQILLNGQLVFEGRWVRNIIYGQGYIRSFKKFSECCPAGLASASYYGELEGGQMHGMGTLYIDSKQKIVAKFHHNIPYGELTYYSQHQIEFGVWPTH